MQINENSKLFMKVISLVAYILDIFELIKSYQLYYHYSYHYMYSLTRKMAKCKVREIGPESLFYPSISAHFKVSGQIPLRFEKFTLERQDTDTQNPTNHAPFSALYFVTKSSDSANEVREVFFSGRASFQHLSLVRPRQCWR